jgi:hypothetical protein
MDNTIDEIANVRADMLGHQEAPDPESGLRREFLPLIEFIVDKILQLQEPQKLRSKVGPITLRPSTIQPTTKAPWDKYYSILNQCFKAHPTVLLQVYFTL